jgi:hypothetical protein
VWQLLKSQKMEVLYDPEIPPLGIYPKEYKSGCNKDTCISMFIAALLTIVKLLKQPKCPTTDEWIKKMWFIYNGILVSFKEE